MIKQRLLWLIPVVLFGAGLWGVQFAQAKRASKLARRIAHFEAPIYPGGVRRKSFTQGTRAGSTAYILVKGTRAEVSEFYRREMERRTYDLQQDRQVPVPVPKSKQTGPAHNAPAQRMLFVNPEEDRVVVVTVIEQPMGQAQLQVAVAHGPLSTFLAQQRR